MSQSGNMRLPWSERGIGRDDADIGPRARPAAVIDITDESSPSPAAPRSRGRWRVRARRVGSGSGPDWRRRYLVSAAVGDAAIAAVISVAAWMSAFAAGVGWVFFTSGLVVVWVGGLFLWHAYDPSVVGDGAEEYRRVLAAGTAEVGMIGVLGVLASWNAARPALLSILGSLAVTLIWRRVRRGALHRRRARGSAIQRTLLVGSANSIAEMAQTLRRSSYHGLDVVAGHVVKDHADPSSRSIDTSVPGDVLAAAESAHAEVVAVLPDVDLGGNQMRDLVWALRGRDIDLLVAPLLLEVYGPRLTLRPVDGLPMFHVSHPELSGPRRLLKSVIDRVGSLLLIVLLSPLLISVAVAIRVTSPGPVFFRQERIGLYGEPFRMVKFRSMVLDAEERRAEVEQRNIHGDPRLFKDPRDPRITSIGRLLRRYSLDELPQLFNVLTGEMSLVGPRPPLPAEVECYGRFGDLRFRVRPGMTGLWQVSGRSDLDPDSALAMDLRYVENWSLAQDAVIMWKTGRAVLSGDGAY